MSVVCFAAEDPARLNIFNVGDAMTNRGWSLASLQFPAAIHICVTMVHTREGVDAKFVSDLRDVRPRPSLAAPLPEPLATRECIAR